MPKLCHADVGNDRQNQTEFGIQHAETDFSNSCDTHGHCTYNLDTDLTIASKVGKR